MYSMKQICDLTGLNYQTVKFYCNKGLIPNVKRNAINHRTFDKQDLNLINGIKCLKRCGMSINDIKHYLDLVNQGDSTLNVRKEILNKQKENIFKKQQELNECLSYIENKQKYYDELIAKSKTK